MYRSEDHGSLATALNASLGKLGTNYVDLYLMHWSQTLLEKHFFAFKFVTAYSPVGKNKFTSHDTVKSIAERHNITGAQALLSWGVQRGTSVIPKTENAQHLKDNFSMSFLRDPMLSTRQMDGTLQIIKLTLDEMHTLDVLHHMPGMHHSVCGVHSPLLGRVLLWLDVPYDQLGWDMCGGGTTK